MDYLKDFLTLKALCNYIFGFREIKPKIYEQSNRV